ncbi:MAG: hypothetical protein RBS07_10905 [Lentimicrobium sp.]|jgi:hypothetical protein|nr:hypothetical protein [Lentimicrobium sp.]
MKKNISLLFIIGIAAMVMNGCNIGMPENKLLGKIPAMALQYYEKNAKLLDEMDLAFDRAERERIEQERSELSRSYKKEFQEYMQTASLKSNIPFEVSGEFPYTVNDVSFKVEESLFKLIFKLTTNETIKRTFSAKVSLYFVGLDSKGEPIVFSIMPAASYILKEELPSGSELELTGIWHTEKLMTLQDFAKLQIISQARYNELEKERNKYVRSY